jgi:hypothetical protein
LIAARLGAYYDEAGGSPRELRTWFVPEGPSLMDTVLERAVDRGELVDTVFLPLATNFGNTPGGVTA